MLNSAVLTLKAAGGGERHEKTTIGSPVQRDRAQLEHGWTAGPGTPCVAVMEVGQGQAQYVTVCVLERGLGGSLVAPRRQALKSSSVILVQS